MPIQKVTSGIIADGAIVATDIADGIVTNAKLAGSITGNKIATGQITGNLLTANCVSGNNIVSSPTITGNVTINGSLSLGGATTPSSGIGIKFPATQIASSDANTLDDYEEGSWTPIAAAQTGTITSYVSNGSYTKIGNTVYIRCYITITNVGTASGTLNCSGLPFVTASGQRPFVALARENAATGNGFMAYPEESDTAFRITALTNVGAITWTNNYAYTFTATYNTI